MYVLWCVFSMCVCVCVCVCARVMFLLRIVVWIRIRDCIHVCTLATITGFQSRMFADVELGHMIEAK